MSCADGGNFLCKKSQFMLAGWGPRPYELKLSLRGAEKLDENCKAGKKKQRRSNLIKLNLMGLLQRIFKNLNNSLKTFRFAMTVTVNFSSLRGRESGCCNQFNYNHERGVKNYYIMSCADGGNFLCKSSTKPSTRFIH